MVGVNFKGVLRLHPDLVTLPAKTTMYLRLMLVLYLHLRYVVTVLAI